MAGIRGVHTVPALSTCVHKKDTASDSGCSSERPAVTKRFGRSTSVTKGSQ